MCEKYPEFSYFFHLSMSVKIAKEISGYNSKLGRDKVYAKEEGDLLGKPISSGVESKEWLYQLDFNPISTETRRWKSGYVSHLVK